MTDTKQPDALAFCWATELAMTQQPVTLSVAEARDVSAGMQRLHAENTTLQAGYDAARLEIESLQARIKTMAEERADELAVAHLDGRMRAAQQPAPSVAVHKACKPDMLVNGGALKLALNVLRRAGKHEVADELEATAQPTPTPQADSQPAPAAVAWYVTGCGRLLDEDEAKAEARRIGGTAKAIPLYTAPQADSAPTSGNWVYADDVNRLVRELDVALNGKAGAAAQASLCDVAAQVRLEAAKRGRPLLAPQADSVLEDAARLKEAVGLLEELAEHDNYSTEYDGRMFSICPECGEQDGEHRPNCAFVRAKAFLAARKQGANHD